MGKKGRNHIINIHKFDFIGSPILQVKQPPSAQWQALHQTKTAKGRRLINIFFPSYYFQKLRRFTDPEYLFCDLHGRQTRRDLDCQKSLSQLWVLKLFKKAQIELTSSSHISRMKIAQWSSCNHILHKKILRPFFLYFQIRIIAKIKQSAHVKKHCTRTIFGWLRVAGIKKNHPYLFMQRILTVLNQIMIWKELLPNRLNQKGQLFFC